MRERSGPGMDREEGDHFSLWDGVEIGGVRRQSGRNSQSVRVVSINFTSSVSDEKSLQAVRAREGRAETEREA